METLYKPPFLVSKSIVEEGIEILGIAFWDDV